MKLIYTFEKLTSEGLIHGITTRGLGSTKKNGKINKIALRRVISYMRSNVKKIVFAEQVHKDEVEFCDMNTAENVKGVDGLITSKPKIMLGVTNADCLSVVFYDRKLNILGICHAGYKGLQKGILQKMHESFSNLGSNSSDMIIGLGPAIGVCCYDVPYSRVRDFLRKYPFLKDIYKELDGYYFLNIRFIAKQMLLVLGAKEENIDEIDMCTKCNNSFFFSFRGDTKEKFGHFATVAYLNE